MKKTFKVGLTSFEDLQALDSLEGLLNEACRSDDTKLYDVLKNALKALEG